MEFTKLFDIGITHDYYNGPCSNVTCVPLPSAAKIIQAGAMRVLAQASQLHLYYEKNETGPLKNITGAKLHFAVVAENASFATVSEQASNHRSVLVYSNNAQANTLAHSETYIIGSGIQTYSISQAKRPVTLTLHNNQGNELMQQVISKANGLFEYSFLMQQYPFGLYSISEKTTNKTLVTHIAYFPHIPPATVAIIQIDIADNFYTVPASFNINFSARSETINYYIVASNYDNSDVQALDMNDAGFSEQARAKILFNKVQSDSFTDQHIAANLFNQKNTKVVLFSSRSAVSRRQYSPKKIQLTLNNEVLIASLPIPGSSSVSADFFIHVAKT